jgi:hypothetical protein
MYAVAHNKGNSKAMAYFLLQLGITVNAVLGMDTFMIK